MPFLIMFEPIINQWFSHTAASQQYSQGKCLGSHTHARARTHTHTQHTHTHRHTHTHTHTHTYIYILYIYIYAILVRGPLCTSECAGECLFSKPGQTCSRCRCRSHCRSHTQCRYLNYKCKCPLNVFVVASVSGRKTQEHLKTFFCQF